LQQCVALIPSDKSSENAYEQLIMYNMSKLNMNCIKADEIFDSTSVLEKTWTLINESQLVVAFLTGRDPDVFYLGGLAYGLGKKIIYLAESSEDIPFDLRQGSSIIYSLKTYDEGKRARNTFYHILKTTLGR